MTLRSSQVNILNVSDLAKICRLTPRTIRFYTKLGLLKPYRTGRWNGYHYYSQEQSLGVFKIKLLQEFGLSLNKIKNLSLFRTHFSFEKELSEIEKEIEEKQKRFAFLQNINLLLFDTKNFGKSLKREVVGPLKLFCLDVKNGDYDKIGDYIDYLRKTALELGIETLDSEITFYPHPAYKPKSSHLEIALICTHFPKKIFSKYPNIPNDFYFKKYPETKVLSFYFNGPYKYLALIYQTFDKFVKEKNMNITSPVFELYPNGPSNTSSEYNYLTKICYPAK